MATTSVEFHLSATQRRWLLPIVGAVLVLILAMTTSPFVRAMSVQYGDVAALRARCVSGRAYSLQQGLAEGILDLEGFQTQLARAYAICDERYG
jgi:hypothetical protein